MDILILRFVSLKCLLNHPCDFRTEFEVLHCYSVDRNLSERIETFAQERRGQVCRRMGDNQPPLPADYPTILVRPF